MCYQRDCKKHDQFIRNCGRAFGTPLRTTYLFPFQIRMGDQGYYDQKFGLTPACIEDVLQIPFFLLRFKHFSPTQKDVGNFDPRRQGIHFLVRNESVRCPSRGARQQSTSHFVLNTCRPSAYTRRVINGRRTREMNVRARHYASSRSREKGAYPDTSKLYLLRTHTLAHRGGRSISLTQGWNLQHQRLQIVNIQQKLLGPHLVHPTLPQNEAQERRKERCHHFVAEIPGISSHIMRSKISSSKFNKTHLHSEW